ncbi:MAG: 1-phosphofructokinase family hexose kinase [Anaerolineaceae bacterium]|jgi:1-phosphofructokinase family hexose kinase
MIYTVTLNPGIDHTLVVEQLDLNSVLRAVRVYRNCGGKGFNVSRALKVLGMESQALGFIGGDSGKWEERQLQSLGITTNFDIIGVETRTCVVIIDTSGTHHIKVNEPGPLISGKEQAALLNRVKSLARAGDFWVFSGSFPPGLAENYYAELINIVQMEGAKACFDSSRNELSAGIKAAPFLIKPNRLEAEELTGNKIDTVEDFKKAANYFLAGGIQMVALSLGVDGLFLSTKTNSVWVIPPRMNALNPVGPGDALLAGVLYGLVNHFILRDIARWGVACGTTSVMKEGVNFGTLDEVQNFLSRIEVVYDS